MSRPRPGPNVTEREIGAELRRLRTAAGITLGRAARELRVSPDTVRRLENSQTAPRTAYVHTLLRLYQADPAPVLARLDAAAQPSWWEPYQDVLPDHLVGRLDLEGAARVIRLYAPGLLPELLTTPDYARAVLQRQHPDETHSAIDRRVELHTLRQQQVLRRPPTRVWALIEEAAFYRRPASPDVMRAQLDHLEQLNADRSSPVAIQVVPATHPYHPAMNSGPVQVLRLDHDLLPDVAVTRTPQGVVISDRAEVVYEYMHMLDIVAIGCPPPGTPLPNTEE